MASPAEKLLIKPKTTVWTSHPRHLDLIEPLPPRVRIVDQPELATTVLIFGEDAQSLRNVVAAHAGRLAESETLWIAYRNAYGDVDRNSLCAVLNEHLLWPVGHVSLDDQWSAIQVRLLEPVDPRS
jgi:hypothetical protein